MPFNTPLLIHFSYADFCSSCSTANWIIIIESTLRLFAMVHIGTESTSHMEQSKSQTINFVFLSCHFPPRFRYFVQKMKQKGVNVLGIGDESYGIKYNSRISHTIQPIINLLWLQLYNLHHELKENLREYFKVHNMEDYDQVHFHRTFFIPFNAYFVLCLLLNCISESHIDTIDKITMPFNFSLVYHTLESYAFHKITQKILHHKEKFY